MPISPDIKDPDQPCIKALTDEGINFPYMLALIMYISADKEDPYQQNKEALTDHGVNTRSL